MISRHQKHRIPLRTAYSGARGVPYEHENDARFDNSESLVDTGENANRNLANPEYSVRRSARSNKGVPPLHHGVNY